MIYYPPGMKLEVVSELFHGSVNDVIVCRDMLSASGTMYTLLVIHDRECARRFLDILEKDTRMGEIPYIMKFAQNEELLFVFSYREPRTFSTFSKAQATNLAASEQIAVNLVMQCLSVALPWPLLRLILRQDCVHITKENTVYFTMNIDLEKLEPECTEKNCVHDCIVIIMKLFKSLNVSKKSKCFELIRKKNEKNVYTCFPELYQDIRITAAAAKKNSLTGGLKGFWLRNRDRLFKILLVICVIAVVVAIAMLVTKMIFGDIPWLRLFQNMFDVIGTQNLHKGEGI